MKKFLPQHLLSISMISFICGFVFFSISGCNGINSKERGKVGTLSPNFRAVDLNGNSYSSEELKGSIIVLNFWFIRCPPCIREIPELNNLVQTYRNEKVVFLAFARDSKNKLSDFLETTPFDYNIVPRSGRMTKRFNTHGFPTNIIIDQQGEIVFHEAAYDAERVNQMDEIIASMIE